MPGFSVIGRPGHRQMADRFAGLHQGVEGSQQIRVSRDVEGNWLLYYEEYPIHRQFLHVTYNLHHPQFGLRDRPILLPQLQNIRL